MEIVWRGERCVLVRGKGVSMLMEPPLGRLEADLVTRSVRPAGLGPCVRVDGARVLSGPGEYDVRGVACVGTPARGATLFSAHVDGIVLAHLGGLVEPPTPEQLAGVDAVDVLIVPIGAGALGPGAAADVVVALEPKIVLPLPLEGDGAALEAFCRRLGAAVPNPRAKLSLTAESLPQAREVALLVAEGRRRSARAA
ncbi:MAG TPA: MBL fold metallo-hydrolase [Chloroflexota bacterium]